jgi:quercetin dioxygenase-like cupin family protein
MASSSGGSTGVTPSARADGPGRVQGWGGKVQEIKAGDVVHTPPNQKHWHGAPATTRMKHISVVEHLDGKNVEVMEPVSDEQYRP